jgi:phage repressor protein C with HTH and peptisase S24 domain
MIEKNELAVLRRANLQAWMDEKTVSRTDLAAKLGVGRAYISNLFNPERFFGEKSARSMEEKLYLPKGYLDEDGNQAMSVEKWDKPTDLQPDTFGLVPRFDYVMLKDGLIKRPTRIPRRTTPLAFERAWLIDAGVTSLKNLTFIKAEGVAMAPYINNGDLVMIDMGQKNIDDGQVYAVHHADIRVRRAHLRKGGAVLLKPDNPRMPEELIEADDLASVPVLGRVLWRCG